MDLFFQIGTGPGCFMAGPSGQECFDCPSPSPRYIPLVDAHNKAISPLMLDERSGSIINIQSMKELVKDYGDVCTTQRVATPMWDNVLSTRYAQLETKGTYKFAHCIAAKVCPMADTVAGRASLCSQTTSPQVNPPTYTTNTDPMRMAIDSDNSDA